MHQMENINFNKLKLTDVISDGTDEWEIFYINSFSNTNTRTNFIVGIRNKNWVNVEKFLKKEEVENNNWTILR